MQECMVSQFFPAFDNIFLSLQKKKSNQSRLHCHTSAAGILNMDWPCSHQCQRCLRDTSTSLPLWGGCLHLCLAHLPRNHVAQHRRSHFAEGVRQLRVNCRHRQCPAVTHRWKRNSQRATLHKRQGELCKDISQSQGVTLCLLLSPLPSSVFSFHLLSPSISSPTTPS